MYTRCQLFVELDRGYCLVQFSVHILCRKVLHAILARLRACFKYCFYVLKSRAQSCVLVLMLWYVIVVTVGIRGNCSGIWSGTVHPTTFRVQFSPLLVHRYIIQLSAFSLQQRVTPHSAQSLNDCWLLLSNIDIMEIRDIPTFLTNPSRDLWIMRKIFANYAQRF